VVALFVAGGLLVMDGGKGLSPVWLVTLLLPGALAAHLSLRGGSRYSWAKEAVLTGAITASVVAVVWTVWLIIAVATTDWTLYAQQAGQQIASAVREVAAPATVLLALVGAVIAYMGCVLASLIGAAIYATLRDAINTSNSSKSTTFGR
jgi:TRAP-type C4-dicarboxylate transport system permease large subunit